ncbi:g26074 [Pararge aegeria aegeria]|uniref:G26074 protein n=1 Tax=Pararge aegeria aegeria TaxID=348720 RepID=A0A8S4RNX8_9NEOP|nr:g26074 [Pararge aegeria aegeria]
MDADLRVEEHIAEVVCNDFHTLKILYKGIGSGTFKRPQRSAPCHSDYQKSHQIAWRGLYIVTISLCAEILVMYGLEDDDGKSSNYCRSFPFGSMRTTDARMHDSTQPYTQCSL